MFLGGLVVGSCIKSILYAFLNDYYFLPTDRPGPLFFEEMDLCFLGSKRRDYTWSRLQTSLALQGLLLNYENPSTIRIRGNQLKVSSSSGPIKYDFQVCDIFDPTGVDLENEMISAHPSSFSVYDDFELSNLGGKHSHLESKQSIDALAKEIHYYISNRVDGANYVTDCVSKSVLTREQLNDFEYSDSMARFAVERHLTSIGIYGNFMEHYKNGSPKYRKPKVTHKKRLIKERNMNHYCSTDNVRFPKLNLQEIFNGFSSPRP